MGAVKNPLKVGANCVKCQKYFTLPDATTIEETHMCTSDCAHCGALHIFIDGMAMDLHEYLNSQDKRWPASGAGVTAIHLN
jgi:hypothetical protein